MNSLILCTIVLLCLTRAEMINTITNIHIRGDKFSGTRSIPAGASYYWDLVEPSSDLISISYIITSDSGNFDVGMFDEANGVKFYNGQPALGHCRYDWVQNATRMKCIAPKNMKYFLIRSANLIDSQNIIYDVTIDDTTNSLIYSALLSLLIFM